MRLSWSASVCSVSVCARRSQACATSSTSRVSAEATSGSSSIGTGPKNSKTPIALPSRRAGTAAADRVPAASAAPTRRVLRREQIGDGVPAAGGERPPDEPGAGRECAGPRSRLERRAHRRILRAGPARRRAQAAVLVRLPVDRRVAQEHGRHLADEPGREVLPGRRDQLGRPRAGVVHAPRLLPGRHVRADHEPADDVPVPVAQGRDVDLPRSPARAHDADARATAVERAAVGVEQQVAVGDTGEELGRRAPEDLVLAPAGQPQRLAVGAHEAHPHVEGEHREARRQPGQQAVGHDRTVDHRPGVAIGRRVRFSDSKHLDMRSLMDRPGAKAGVSGKRAP